MTSVVGPHLTRGHGDVLAVDDPTFEVAAGDRSATSEPQGHRPTGWLRSPLHDLTMALLWLPFVAAARMVTDDQETLRWLVSATLLFSFAHQPLTLWLVYGDSAQRAAHRRLALWGPVAAVAVVGAGTSLRPDVVALVAGVWNVAHTLRQRYGVSRLYGRLAGFDCSGDNRLLWSWLALATVVALTGTDLVDAARRAGLGRRNTTAVDVLASADAAGAALLLASLSVAVWVTVAWLRDERRRTTHSLPRVAYLASTAVLFVVLAVDPVAGFVGYVGAHAAEYFLVVRWRIQRAGQQTRRGDGVGALVRRVGSNGTIALYAVLVAALIAGLAGLGASHAALALTLTLGALHLAFDSVIWRSPKS
jgi:hypothetical protein